jgi:hypothetical protein
MKADNRSIAEKVKQYNDANREVAILCNHKRTVGASHEAQMEKLGDRVSGRFFIPRVAKFGCASNGLSDKGFAVPTVADEDDDVGYRSETEEEEGC